MRGIIPLVLTLMATPACAQTAEETMVYMLHGFEGAPISANTSNGRTITMEKYPELENGILLKITTSIPDSFERGAYGLTKINDCKYAVTVLAAKVGKGDLPLEPMVKVTMDWSKVSGLSFDHKDGILIAKPEGLDLACDTEGDGCSFAKANPILYINLGSQKRVEKAFEYFQRTYCKGSAF